ncbi:MAG TPA: DsrE family protein [Steroidobacteraceae bacterium]|nr:DsrE family protein [Steroidobacteraceae bacterium]
MRHVVSLTAAGVLACFHTIASAAPAPEGFWTTPAIAGYGRIHPLPQAAYKPDPSRTYRIVFAMTAASQKPGEVSPSLERVARTVNLYVSSGVPLSHLRFVAVAYGAATPLALNDAQYEAAYGVSNPNLPLVAALRRAGVDIAVCGQAVAEHGYQYEWIDSSVTVALSALTTLTTLEEQGYHLMPL